MRDIKLQIKSEADVKREREIRNSSSYDEELWPTSE